MRLAKLKKITTAILLIILPLTVTASALTVVPRIPELSFAAKVTYGSQSIFEDDLTKAWKTAVTQSQSYDNVTVTLLTDWKASSSGFGSGDGFKNGALYYKAGKGITLDLNGHTINRNQTSDKTGGCVFCIAGNMTVTDSSEAHTAVITGGYNDDEGGAIAFESGGKLTINGCTIRNCKSDSDGGAVYLTDYTNKFTADGTVFEQNWSDDYGGAIFANDGTVTLTNCVFRKNTCECGGGAVWIDEGNLAAANCVFTDNHSVDDGGAVYINTDTKARLEDCSFENNAVSDDSGGAVYINSSDGAYLVDCVMKNNRATDYGGAVCINGDRCFIIGGDYTGNTAGYNGGGIYVDSRYDVNIAGRLVVSGNKTKSKENDLCLQSGYFSTAYLYCGGLNDGSDVAICSTSTSSNLAIKGIDRYQYENYIRFDSGFCEDKRVKVTTTGDTVRVEGSAIGRGSLISVTVLVVIAVIAFSALYLTKRRREAKRNDGNE